MAKTEKSALARVGTTDTDVLTATSSTIIKYAVFTNKNTAEISHNDGLGNGVDLTLSKRDTDNEVYALPKIRLHRYGADGHYIQFDGGLLVLEPGQTLVAKAGVDNSIDCHITYFEG